MIQYNNQNNWKEIHYQGHSIKEAYSSLGLVWSAIPSMPKWIATYSDSHTESASCDGSSVITQDEITLEDLVDVQIGGCVTSIGWAAFSRCSGLTSVTIPDSVTSIGWAAFRYCEGLTSIDIPNSVTSIDDEAFQRCTSLTSVTIPSGVTSIGEAAFFGCTSLTSITVNAATPPALGADALIITNNAPIYVPCQSVEAYKSAWSTYASRIQCIEPPTPTGTKFSATYSDSTTFSAECNGDSTLTVETTQPSGHQHSAMTSAVIGDCITTIGWNALNGCRSLTSVTIPNSVTVISGDAFDVCTSLSSITIPSGVTSIGEYSFKGCTSLTSITIEALQPPTLGNYVFWGTPIEIIYVPAQSVSTYQSAWSAYSSRIRAI